MEIQNRLIVSKFGGSSMADPESIRQVMSIIRQNPERRMVVVSAPGKNEQYSSKITDQLINRNYGEFFTRFENLAEDLGWQQGPGRIAQLRRQLSQSSGFDFRISRGEWLTAQMLADLMESQFVDASELLRINNNRTVHDESYARINQRLGDVQGRVVVPGFYGADQRGWIRTLPRDGSDITGAVLARALKANRYEIFSDTNGVYTQDPRMNPEAQNLAQISFAEMEVLSQTAKIVQSQAVAILHGTGVSINCRNTFNMDHPGTWIS